MKATRCTFFRRLMGLCHSAALIFTMLVLTVAATTAPVQTPVFVPGNSTGCFGSTYDGCTPLVAALAISGPGEITVTYVSGTVNWGGGDVGPNGGFYGKSGYQFPLQEANGFAPHTKIGNIAALIGVFVPQSRVLRKGFNALDGTKNVARVGIMPGGLFFIGEGKTIDVKEAGTLFLGINDTYVADNSGGFNVTVTGP
jgi:hypothetical protein